MSATDITAEITGLRKEATAQALFLLDITYRQLQRRSKTVRRIARCKKQTNEAISGKAREEEILELLRKHNTQLGYRIPEYYLSALVRLLMEESRRTQKEEFDRIDSGDE